MWMVLQFGKTMMLQCPFELNCQFNIKFIVPANRQSSAKLNRSVECRLIKQKISVFIQCNHLYNTAMIFNQTFKDPTKPIYYPSTWGGKTAVENFEDMKLETWYICLSYIIKLVIGFVWLFLLYAFAMFLIEMIRLYRLPDGNREKREKQLYIRTDFMIRWITLGTFLMIITGIWLTHWFTQLSLILGACGWVIVLIVYGIRSIFKNKQKRPKQKQL